MRASLLIVAIAFAACHAPAASVVPSNEQRVKSPPAGDITKLRLIFVRLFQLKCPGKNLIEVTIDERTTTVDFPCPPDDDVVAPSGNRVVVTDSGLDMHEMKPPVQLAPGRHRVRVRHVTSNVVGETELAVPQYFEVGPSWPSDRKVPLLDVLVVRVTDTYEEVDVPGGIRFDPLGGEPLSM